MRIAIIGSGVSGLVSAYLLAPHHEVEIFEKDTRIGGHAHTLIIHEKGRKIAVDNGFMVFNPDQYPNFVMLLKHLGVKSVGTNMSLGVSVNNSIAYRGDFPCGLFANKSNLINIHFWKFLYEVFKFRMLAKKLLKTNKNPNDTLAAFIHRYGFSTNFTNWFLYPMLSAIWSAGESERVSEFPALSIFSFMNNHKLLDLTQPQWRTIQGGSIQYVSKVHDFLKQNNVAIHLKTNILGVSRKHKKVQVHTEQGSETFDYIVFATHADVALHLLSDATEQEKEALSLFAYSVNRTILHKDRGMIPKNPSLVASWNVRSTVDHSGKHSSLFTYCMNKLQHISEQFPVLVTLNPDKKIDKNKKYHEEVYEHPTYTFNTLKGQRLIKQIQGKRRTLFAGAHLGYGFHEDGVVSALRAVKKIGVEPPWINAS